MRDEEPSSSLVAIDVAIQIEECGRDFYRRAAAIAEDGGGGVLFAFLADAEAEHLRILKAYRQSLNSDGRRSSCQEMEEVRQPAVEEGLPLYPRLSLGQNAGAYVPDLLALRTGLLIEEAASAFYGRAAARSAKVDDKSLYEKLLNMETEHHGILEEEYDGLAREFSRVLGFPPF